MLKRILSLLVSFSAAAQLNALAIPYDTYMSGRHEYTSAPYKISPGLTYTEYLTDNEKYGYERSFVYEYTPMQGTTVVPSSGHYVYGTTSLGTITKELENEGVRVVGGINGDFYSTATGVPIGGMIIDREIYSSDNDRTAMGFDSDGKAFISKPGIAATLSDGKNDIILEHINKYPLEYSLYLLTDRFYPTTKTTLSSTEIVLMPYSDVKVYLNKEEYKKDINLDEDTNEDETHEGETKENTEENTEDSKEDIQDNTNEETEKTEETEEHDGDKAETSDLETDSVTEEIGTETESETEADTDTEETLPEKDPEYFWLYSSDAKGEETEDLPEHESSEPNDEADEIPDESLYEQDEITDEPEKDAGEDDENLPADNEKTDENTSDESDKTEDLDPDTESDVSENDRESEEPQDSDQSEEHVEQKEQEEQEESIESDEEEFFAKRYTVSDEKLTIGCELKVVAIDIRRDSINSEIPEGCFVICAENINQLPRVSHIKAGDEFTLSVSANDEWYDAVHAIGNAGGLILKDGEYCDDVEIDHYPYAHPRTAAGITADGRVIFYCVDGRQNSSGGMRIDQLSHEMKKLGCVIAMNLDGGGSTTAYAALPGESFSTLKNSPSGIVERKTANSLVFINTTERSGNASRFTFYPERPYVVAGGSEYLLPKPSATDSNFHPVDLPDDFSYNYYTSPIQTDSVILDGNRFVSGEKCGPVKVYVHVEQDGQTIEYMAGTVFVLSDITDFSFDVEEIELDPFESFELTFKAGYHTAPLFYDKNSLRFSLPEVKEDDSDVAVDVIDTETESLPETDETLDDIIPDAEPENTDENEGEKQEQKQKEYFPIPEQDVLGNEKGNITKDLVFTPTTHSETLVFSAKLGSLVRDITIRVGEYPFIDSFSHWSAKNLMEIYKLNLMQGELVGEDLAFVPQRNMTKSEFITVLARMLYPDVDEESTQEEVKEGETAVYEDMNDAAEVESEEAAVAVEESVPDMDVPADVTENDHNPETPDASGTDVNTDEYEAVVYPFSDSADIPRWALKYYDAMNESGLLELLVKQDENGNARIYPSEHITRYDVLVMLGALCEETEEDLLFEYADSYIFDASPHKQFINSAVKAGIFEGYEDKTLRPANLLTRAEAATVILRFYNKEFSPISE